MSDIGSTRPASLLSGLVGRPIGQAGWVSDDEAMPIPPAAITLGAAERDVDPETATSRLTFDAPDTLANMMGFVQGGFVAAMLDSSMGLALRSVMPKGSTGSTLEMKVSYLRPARIGRLIGSGRVLQRGRTIAFLEGELHDASGELLAKATSTVRIVAPR